MAEEKKIAYIGKKPFKKVNRFGRDYLFLQGEATSVPEQVAFNLLQTPSCFALPEHAKKAVQQLEDEAELKAKLAAEAKEKAEREAKAKTWKVFIDGEEVNISKYTKGQLEAVIVAEELAIDPLSVTVPEGVTPAEALRMAVRDALHGKSGNPELAGE